MRYSATKPPSMRPGLARPSGIYGTAFRWDVAMQDHQYFLYRSLILLEEECFRLYSNVRYGFYIPWYQPKGQCIDEPQCRRLCIIPCAERENHKLVMGVADIRSEVHGEDHEEGAVDVESSFRTPLAKELPRPDQRTTYVHRYRGSKKGECE